MEENGRLSQAAVFFSIARQKRPYRAKTTTNRTNSLIAMKHSAYRKKSRIIAKFAAIRSISHEFARITPLHTGVCDLIRA
jgi:ethanolamine utilization protein EutP (predicted NTPase)